jgi:hypothetical protein
MISQVRHSKKKPRGYVIWKGPSLLDGAPVVLIATRGSKRKANEKTGAMVQTYILRADIPPIEAMKTGADSSICGNCQHRPANNGTCYVRIDTGPNMVYRAFIRGKAYHDATRADLSSLFPGEHIRIGSYGDPSAIPVSVWTRLVSQAEGYTGYTHQWKEPAYKGLAAFCMASCDTLEETTQAQAQGWRTFSVIPSAGELAIPKGAMLCPASEQGGYKLNCNQCLACDGLAKGRHSHVVIPVHGVNFKQVRFNNLIQIGG